MQQSTFRETSQIVALLRLMRVDKPWGTVLLLWPTLWALWLANDGSPSVDMIAIFVCGAVLMRACGCVINDYCDHDLDAKVHRTQSRPLATGEISQKQAISCALILALAACSLLLLLNSQTKILAVIGFMLTVIYPTTKRWLSCPQLFLGITFAWGIPMAYSASNQILGSECWGLYALTSCWIVGYDTIYAMQDLPDDQHLPIHTMPKLLGSWASQCVAILYSVFCIGLGFFGWAKHMRWPFFCALLMTGIMLIQQIRSWDTLQANRFTAAFKMNQWLGLVVWLGIMAGQ